MGAFRGWYTVLAGKLVGIEGHVYAFEPEPRNFQVLWRVCLLSGLRNLTLYKLALSDRDGIERTYLSEHPSMHSIVLRRGGSVIGVKSIRLDTLVSLGIIPRLDLVKIDVEGAELKVLRGAKSTISKFKPILSIDVNHYEGEFEEVRAFLEEINYEYLPLSGDISKPYSIVAYPTHKRNLARRLIIRTKKLAASLKAKLPRELQHS